MGLACFEPLGAFYLFPSIKGFWMDSLSFAYRLFKEKKLAVTPGTAFGETGIYNNRISYASSYDDLAKGMDKLEGFIKGIRHSLKQGLSIPSPVSFRRLISFDAWRFS